MKHRFVTAGPIWTFILDRLNFAAITTPWRTIYEHPDFTNDPRIRRHELAHIAQIDRDGAWYFWPKIIFDFFWYGHQNSPYEVEARTAEDDTQ